MFTCGVSFQLAEKYAVAAPSSTEPEQQSTSIPQPSPQLEDLTDTGTPTESSELLDNFPALQPTDQPSAGSSELHHAGVLHTLSQEIHHELQTTPMEEMASPETPVRLPEPDIAPEHPTAAYLSASRIPNLEATVSVANADQMVDDQQQADSRRREDGAGHLIQAEPPQVSASQGAYCNRANSIPSYIICLVNIHVYSVEHTNRQ